MARKLLFFGRKVVIINQVLQFQTVNLLPAMVPPKKIIDQIEMYLTNLFWGSVKKEKRITVSTPGYHELPKEERGLGFKKIEGSSNSIAARRWWRLRTENNLWTKLFLAKYCLISNVLSKIVNFKDSNIWRDVLNTRDKVERFIHWKINKGNNMFWCDNWPTLAL